MSSLIKQYLGVYSKAFRNVCRSCLLMETAGQRVLMSQMAYNDPGIKVFFFQEWMLSLFGHNRGCVFVFRVRKLRRRSTNTLERHGTRTLQLDSHEQCLCKKQSELIVHCELNLREPIRADAFGSSSHVQTSLRQICGIIQSHLATDCLL